jgi:hypothetical protein
MSKRRRKHPKQRKFKPRPNQPIRYTEEDIRRVRKHFLGSSGWRIFMWFHCMRVRWRWMMLFVFLTVIFLWVLGIEHMQHIGLAMAIEQVLHTIGLHAVDTAKDEL